MLASPVELKTSIEMAHSLTQIDQVCANTSKTDEEFHALTSLTKLEMMVAKASADRDRCDNHYAFFWRRFMFNVLMLADMGNCLTPQQRNALRSIAVRLIHNQKAQHFRIKRR